MSSRGAGLSIMARLALLANSSRLASFAHGTNAAVH